MKHDENNLLDRSGDALRNTAVALLSQKYRIVIPEHRVEGKKVDIYFESDESFVRKRFFVECKDYARALKRSEVVHIFSDYLGISNEKDPHDIIIITRNGLTADASKFVYENRRNFLHLTIWELENKILGLTEYNAYLSNFEYGKDISDYYIDPMAKMVEYIENDERVQTKTVNLIKSVCQWIESDETRPLAVLAGYGSGKTSFARRLASLLATRALQDPKARSPVLIELGNFTRAEGLEAILGKKFTNDFSVHSFRFQTFIKLNNAGRLVVILDGFDEMKHAMSWNEFKSQMQDLNRVNHGGSKVLLLGRPSAFLTMDEHSHILRGIKKNSIFTHKIPDWPEFIEYDMAPFSHKEIELFLERYMYSSIKNGNKKLDDEQIKSRVKNIRDVISSDISLFERPIHLKIISDLAIDSNISFPSGGEISKWMLYGWFFDFLIDREVQKKARIEISESPRLDFIKEIAYWLWSKMGGRTYFSVDEIRNNINISSILPDVNGDDYESHIRELLIGSFLERKFGDIFYFPHRSFAEFLVAKKMIDMSEFDVDISVFSKLYSEGIESFLKSGMDNATLLRWCGKVFRSESDYSYEFLEFLINCAGGIIDLVYLSSSELLPRKIISRFSELGGDVLSSEWLIENFKNFDLAEQKTICCLIYIDAYRLFKIGDQNIGKITYKFYFSFIANIIEIIFANILIDNTYYTGVVHKNNAWALNIINSIKYEIDNDDGAIRFKFDMSNLFSAIIKFVPGHGMNLKSDAFSDAFSESELYLRLDQLRGIIPPSALTNAYKYFGVHKDFEHLNTDEYRLRKL